MWNDTREKVIARATAALLLFQLAGCGGDGLPREPVSGSISVDGKPLKSGMVMFTPTDASMPTQGNGNITDGKYSIPRSAGLVPGTYKVVINSSESTPEKQLDKVNDAPGLPPAPAKNAIPPEFGSETKLTAEIVAGGPNVKEFNIQTKGGTAAPSGDDAAKKEK